MSKRIKSQGDSPFCFLLVLALLLVAAVKPPSTLLSVQVQESEGLTLQAPLLVSNESATAQQSKGMLPDSHPIPLTTPHLLGSTILPGGSQGPRGSDSERCQAAYAGLPTFPNQHSALAATPSAVSSLLGRRFTLVGAKPSGTS